MKWLFVTREFPWPLTGGGWLRTYNLAKALRVQGEQVSLLSYRGPHEGSEKYVEAGVTLIDGPAGTSPTQGPSRSFLAPFVYDDRLADRVVQNAPEFDVIVLVGIATLHYSPEAQPAGCVVADIIDDPLLEEYRRLWRDLRPRHFARRLKFLAGERFYERAFVNRVDLATFVSRQDADSFIRRHPGVHVAFLPGGVDMTHFARNSTTVNASDPPSITFVGSMGHFPNQDAAIYLIRSIAPHLWKTHPSVRFDVVGCNPPEAVCRLAGPNVHVTGYVDDVRRVLWDTTVVMAPMRIGTGVKNKILEAWAAGTPVVTTPLACQGITARNEENLLIAGSPEGLAHAAVRLIQDGRLRAKIAAGGLETVRRHHDWSVIASQLYQQVARLVLGEGTNEHICAERQEFQMQETLE